ncbi:unnamed protein product [Pseudo-nitzschia multistriata]|uniref:Uncharacterized protein n=1 Tax=Pseudo-nitzschia multistriata TaxID=183589 RepID=A0A448Z3Q6_9STRA|nr:unnamed protein product [Pseudo-nitzschia multistriata]
MVHQSTPSCPSGQMNTFKRNRTSILRPHELVEIQGSYWPRILVLSEYAEGRRKKSKFSKESLFVPIKVSRRLKKKEMLQKLKKLSPTSSPMHRPLSPSFVASPNALASIPALDQGCSACWKPFALEPSKTKTSSLTGRVVVSQKDNAKNHVVGQSSSGLKGPRRRKPLTAGLAHR